MAKDKTSSTLEPTKEEFMDGRDQDHVTDRISS